MKKMNTSPISGTEELLPSAQADFDKLKAAVSSTFQKNGFLSIETPMLERTEILLAKAGGETEKQIYKVFKTSESAADATEALRFDHTVPLARYIVEHESDLTFPFKVMQDGKNFRGERAQKGRYREFYQNDVDVIGRSELPLFYDADVISTLIETYQNMGLLTPVVARISNRKILKGLLSGLNLEEKSGDICSIIDHSEKVPLEKTIASLEEIGLNEAEKQKILDFIDIRGEREGVKAKILALGVESALLSSGLEELDYVLRLLELAGHEKSIVADMRIVRGLDYYTGTVFEFALPEHPEIGSVGGGGRYENLAEFFTEQKFPGAGGSIGLNRLFYVINEKNLLSTTTKAPLDYAIIPLTENELEFSLDLAKKLRSGGHKVTLVPGDKKLGDKLKYASKISKNAIVIGKNEVKTGEYEIKEFN